MTHSIIEYDPDTNRGTCAICGPDVPVKKRYGQQAGTFRCRKQWKTYEKKTMKDGTRIDKREVEKIRVEQQGRCAICKQEKPLVIDHCHKTRQLRGLLCRECNLGLGYFEDSVDTLNAAAQYLASSFYKKCGTMTI